MGNTVKMQKSREAFCDKVPSPEPLWTKWLSLVSEKVGWISLRDDQIVEDQR
jgi:hypothetical protein